MEKLCREEMIAAVSAALAPAGSVLSNRWIDGYVLCFCASCPDPVRAYDLMLNAEMGSSGATIVDQALALPVRAVESWSDGELASEHPLRRPIFSR